MVEETTDAIAAVMTLNELSFTDVLEGEFTASFTAPWDDEDLSFDVEQRKASQPAVL